MITVLRRHIIKPLLICNILLISIFPLSSQASKLSSIEPALASASDLVSETEINYTAYKANGTPNSSHLLLWFYSEAGPQANDKVLAKQLADSGIEVWLIDLFDSYFLPVALSSMDKIPATDISLFIEQAALKTGKKITAVTTGRSAIPLLRAVRQSQINFPDSKALNGMILISPKFYTKTPEPGQTATLMPIVSNSNVLTFVIQPNNSPWFWKLDKTIPALEKSGSDVYLQVIKNVRDRFYFRPDATKFEQDKTLSLAAILKKAMLALANHPSKVRYANQNNLIKPKAINTKTEKTLKSHKGNPIPPELSLLTLDNKTIQLKDLKNKVVLVNFWASWCPPCVHEMPSMQRLQDSFKRDEFVILGVNMAEDQQTIKDFTKNTVAIDFPILMDTDGAALKRWQVFAFPTSYLIDKNGKIRYSLFGSIEWDTRKTKSIVNQLINE